MSVTFSFGLEPDFRFAEADQVESVSPFRPVQLAILLTLASFCSQFAAIYRELHYARR